MFFTSSFETSAIYEFYPIEAVKTNIGTNNVLDPAIQHGVKKVICLSTDIVYPINAMGMSKSNGKSCNLENFK